MANPTRDTAELFLKELDAALHAPAGGVISFSSPLLSFSVMVDPAMPRDAVKGGVVTTFGATNSGAGYIKPPTIVFD